MPMLSEVPYDYIKIGDKVIGASGSNGVVCHKDEFRDRDGNLHMPALWIFWDNFQPAYSERLSHFCHHEFDKVRYVGHQPS